MKIGLKEIDPQVAQALEERLCAPLHEFLKEDIHFGGILPFNWKFQASGLKVTRKRDPNEDEKKSYEMRKKREETLGLRGVVAAFVPLGVGGGLGGLLASGSPTIAAVTGGLTWLVGTAAGIRWTINSAPKSRLRNSVSLEEMRAVFPLLKLSRSERIYCDTLLMLVRIQTSPEAETTMRETMRQINVLLESSRQLETRRKALLPVLGTNSIQDLEMEYGDLGRRFDASTDVIARQSLQQSLQMCATRLENARACEQGLERLKVQEEAIMQTLSSAMSSLARMQIIAAPQTELAAQQIAETVAQMNQQTYAVEKAVEEVMTLRVQ